MKIFISMCNVPEHDCEFNSEEIIADQTQDVSVIDVIRRFQAGEVPKTSPVYYDYGERDDALLDLDSPSPIIAKTFDDNEALILGRRLSEELRDIKLTADAEKAAREQEAKANETASADLVTKDANASAGSSV